uniref:NADH-ubiquinone oxidoreductase chain 6 n=1 Tax=Scolytinae sp. BMNH 1040351 TaxID=1903793 RepID=A0A343A690_9CUCU|nr:NADH dehydrogenase subunit 6 [Scolytinae sp. BMNH 1040351]
MEHLLLMNWVTSSTFLFMKHPLAMGGMLLIQTIISTLFTGMLFTNFWFSYILFLIMIGGMLIMFMYMTSVASNEKFQIPNLPTMILITFISAMGLMLVFFPDKTMSSLPLTNMSTEALNFKATFMKPITKFFNLPNFLFSIALMVYMLLTLIAVVKITDKKMGPLRQK